MERKLLVTIDGMRIEIDGQEILLVLIPIPPSEHESPIHTLIKLQKELPVVFVSLKSDGTLDFVSPPVWSEKLKTKTIFASQLTKIPFYESDQASEPDKECRF